MKSNFYLYANFSSLILTSINMKKNFLGQWMLLTIVCLGLSVGETYAQKYEFANFKRFAKDNSELSKPTKKDKRVVFMGNSITEGWINTHPDFFKKNGYISRGIGGQTLINFCCAFAKM